VCMQLHHGRNSFIKLTTSCVELLFQEDYQAQLC
jgi:hypothetical protein